MAAFRDRLRDEVDLDALNADLPEDDPRHRPPATATLWLRGDYGAATQRRLFSQ